MNKQQNSLKEKLRLKREIAEESKIQCPIQSAEQSEMRNLVKKRIKDVIINEKND